MYLFIQTLIDRPDISEGGYWIFDCAQGSRENDSNYHSDTDYEYASPHVMPLSVFFGDNKAFCHHGDESFSPCAFCPEPRPTGACGEQTLAPPRHVGSGNSCPIVQFSRPETGHSCSGVGLLRRREWIPIFFLVVFLSFQAEGEDNLKKMQLMELAILNGTYRDNNIKARK